MMENEERVLLSGYGWQAELWPDFGMNTVRLSLEGRPILRSPASRAELLENPAVYGTPALMPPNRTENGTFRFDGRTYHLPINEPKLHNHLHGFLRCAHFTVTECSGSAVTGVYQDDGSDYPFPYRLTVRCGVDASGYHQAYTFENTGRTDMPLTFGLHTSFIAQDSFCVPVGKERVRNSCCIPTGELAELNEQTRAFRTGCASEGKALSGFFTSDGCTARIGRILYTVSDHFGDWIVWNGGGKDGFLCVEPQCGAVNSLNSGVGLLRLKPGEAETFKTWFHTDVCENPKN